MMATACGPEGPAQFLPIGMDTTTPCHVSVGTLAQTQSNEAGPQPSGRTSLPPPNPPFVFPARPAPPSAPPSRSRATGRRPRSAIETSDNHYSFGEDSDSPAFRPHALPAFSFNPGVDLASDSSMLSPPLSPQSPRNIPSRSNGHGHRRGGSEFVGGSIRGGDAIAVLGTSPTKSESGFASPTLPPPRPAGRRGHAHRRSQALSSHDLSTIMNPSSVPNIPRGSSAPSSPASLEHPSASAEIAPKDQAAETIVSNTSSQPTPTPTPETEDSKEITSSAKPLIRARVGFSDAIEYIPRPLSLISSDTSSTITARPGHSVSGSISSVMSGTAPAPVEVDVPPTLVPTMSRGIPESRPSTAGAILERTQSKDDTEEVSASPRRRNSIPLLLSLGSTSNSRCDPSPTKTPKRWSFFGLEPFATLSPKTSRPASAGSSSSSSRHISSANSSMESVQDVMHEEAYPPMPKAAVKKGAKKQRKVKAWAGSILTRRSKTKHKTKAASQAVKQESADSECAIMAEDTTPAEPSDTTAVPLMPVVLVTESPEPQTSEPPRTRPVGEDDGSYAVIDLDAALGPFNTPLPFNPEWEAAQKAGAPAKRKLHSAAGMSHFSGPGGHYHRRAESAPEMAPFEHGRFSIHRFGSSSNMADVFEEEEEEDDDESHHSLKNTRAGSDASVKPVAEKTVAKVQEDGKAMDANDSKSSIAATDDENPTDSDEVQSPLASMEKMPSPTAPLQSTAPDAAILEITLPARVDNCDSPDASPRRIVPVRELSPVDISLHLPSASLAPGSPFSMTHSSSFPSPRSPMSYDANRVSTAPSSIAEENTFHSLLMGEPGPEVRYSIDADIPSLTSSNSTMTKDSLFAHNPQSSHGNLPGQRPASFSYAAFSRRRSSLASLSRFINSSHGEKSKLSMEVSCDSEPERKQKDSKKKRLSRKLQFWKSSKETSST